MLTEDGLLGMRMKIVREHVAQVGKTEPEYVTSYYNPTTTHQTGIYRLSLLVLISYNVISAIS